MITPARLLIFLATVLLFGVGQSADSHGILRRLFGRPQPACAPVPPLSTPTLQPAPAKKAFENTLEGRVTFKGPLPFGKPIDLDNFGEAKQIIQLLRQARAKGVLDGHPWRIDPKTRGVANVVVFLKQPKEGALPIDPRDKVRTETIVLDAPLCVFEPHVFALYPSWFDGKMHHPTGQEFKVKNSAPVQMNVLAVGHPLSNPGFNLNLLPGTEVTKTKTFKPQLLPVTASSGAYTWMEAAKAFVFDHPYFAITKDDGTFSIPRVPAGVEVQVMAWHESQGWLFTREGKTMKLQAGKNTLDFEIGAK